MAAFASADGRSDVLAKSNCECRHLKGEQSQSHDEAAYFAFEWQLVLTFDRRVAHSIGVQLEHGCA